jgi:hypothetical protein
MATGIPPYVAHRTFENFLAELKARGLPSRIDRSILSHKSGTVQSQLLLCFQYLDLLTSSGRPTEKLRALLATEGRARKNLLREIIRSAYPFIFDAQVDLSSATQNQIEELFRQTGASGETVRRCISFFLAAARNAGIPFSPYLRPHRGKKSSSRVADSPAQSAGAAKKATGLAVKTINLRSGGLLRMELSFDIFRLDRADREFVFSLIDRFNAYSEEGDTVSTE